MKELLKKRTKTAAVILLSCAAGAFAYAGSSYILNRHIFALSAGGDISSAQHTMQTSAGASISGTLSGSMYQMSAGFLTGSAAVPVKKKPEDDLPDYVYVYPNPYRPGSGTDYDAEFLTFANIPDVDEIKIYNLAGELVNTVRQEPDNGNIRWTPVNRAERRLDSGVYIYQIHRKKGKTLSGKFSVIY